MIEHASESTEQNANSRVLKLPVPERTPVLSGPVRKTPDQSQAHSAFPVIRLVCDFILYFTKKYNKLPFGVFEW